jgi:Fe-S cluster assembly protein SufD
MTKKKVISIKVKKNQQVIYPFVWINGKEEEITIKVDLQGDNASFLLCGIFLGSREKQIIFNTEVTHIGKNTKSLTTMRAVFFDNSSFNNDGMVRINKGAKNTDGYFQSKVLLFDNAKGRSVPSLEIDENEVKAGHGSTIGRPDQNQLFYLRSRGLTEKDAEALIVSGFFEPIIDLFPKDRQSKTRKDIHNFHI